MVSAEGEGRLLEGAEAKQAIACVRAKYMVPGALAGIERAWGPIDDVCLVVTPERWRSWTGTLLEEAAVKELGDDYERAWLPDD
ncbi:hypothetical protein [Agromyces laixinhei]|uniref:hypothetical protein n=1 Tax=Agromyces laixinhei TaxID=2585717 RepID=UPI0012ED9C6D|nr:hypothetical protein [Agromyces laixinhei]